VVRLAILDILTIIPNFLRAMGLMVGAEEAAGLSAGLGFFAAMTPAGGSCSPSPP
jgi:hypothetical protein